MSTLTICRIALPTNFRRTGLLAFHQRDIQQIAERVDGDVLHKGILWRGVPACLGVTIGADEVEVTLAVDGTPAADDAEQVQNLVRRMLGLTQPVEAFEQKYREHPLLGPLLRTNAGLGDYRPADQRAGCGIGAA